VRCVTNTNLATHGDLGESAASPVRAQGCLKTGERLFHSLARCHLAADGKADVTDGEHLTPRSREVDSTQQNVRAPTRRIEDGPARLGDGEFPRRDVEQGDLTSPAAIDVAGEPDARDERRTLNGVHRTAVRALEPEGLDAPSHGQSAISRTSGEGRRR
jgi:hypothetical protein